MVASKRRLVFLLSIATCAVVPCLARAEAGSNEAMAQQLFDEGKLALAAKDYGAACPKFEQSLKLSRAGGTLLFLAICREGEGRVATAWVLFNEVVSAARKQGRADRERVAREHIDALTPRLQRVTIAVEAPATGEELRIDGAAVGREAWFGSFPADPGEHVLEASAPLKVTYRTKFRVPQDPSLMVPALARDLDAEARAARERELDARERRAAVGSLPRTIGIVALGAGAVGVGLGTAFGLISRSKHGAANANCRLGPTGDKCSPQGIQDDDDASRAGNASTIAFVAGGVFLAAGAVLLLTAPRARSVAWVSAGPNGLAVRGGF